MGTTGVAQHPGRTGVGEGHWNRTPGHYQFGEPGWAGQTASECRQQKSAANPKPQIFDVVGRSMYNECNHQKALLPSVW
jgi:hypothetical protein